MCEELFERIEQLKGEQDTQCTAEVSYMEIYSEQVSKHCSTCIGYSNAQGRLQS